VAQQGFPPRRSPRQPDSGRIGRHGAPAPEIESDRELRQDWPSQPERPEVADRGTRARPDAGPRPDAGARARPDGGVRPDPGVRPDRQSRPDRTSRPARPDQESWRHDDPFTAGDDEGDLPPWAGLSIYPARPGGGRVRPPVPDEPDEAPPGGGAPGGRGRRRGRAAAARLRRSRRRVVIWCGTAIALAVIIAVVLVIHGLGKPAPKSDFVNTLQAGEFRSVPNSCRSVSPALLSQYLPGTARKVTSAGPSSGTSQCSFTVDQKPVFRVLEVTLQAFAPSAIPAGDGSATANATDTFLVTQAALAHPGKKAPLPPAAITPVPGLGQQALSALQVSKASRAITDLVTVMARERNVLVTVSLQAQASGNGFGPVSASNLRAAALAVSRSVLAKAAAGPAVTG
jgi:hypothetical protein